MLYWKIMPNGCFMKKKKESFPFDWIFSNPKIINNRIYKLYKFNIKDDIK